MGRLPGSFAEYALMDESDAIPVPDNVSWEDAAAIPLAGCGPDPCKVGSYCDGDVAHYCGLDFENRRTASDRDCARQGQICLSTNSVECVFPDQPCTRSRCDGGDELLCGANGFVTERRGCAASAEPNRSCIELPDQSLICGYPSMPCTDPGSDGVCSADGAISYVGCGTSGYPRFAVPCPTGFVCATGNSTSDCVDPARIPCEGVPDEWGLFCSADMTTIHRCSPVGFVTTTESCAAMGRLCVVDDCVLDIPCDPATARSKCSTDQQTIYTCGSHGLAVDATPCPTRQICTETVGSNGRVAAACLRPPR